MDVIPSNKRGRPPTWPTPDQLESFLRLVCNKHTSLALAMSRAGITRRQLDRVRAADLNFDWRLRLHLRKSRKMLLAGTTTGMLLALDKECDKPSSENWLTYSQVKDYIARQDQAADPYVESRPVTYTPIPEDPTGIF